MLHHCPLRHSELCNFLLLVAAYSNGRNSSGSLVLGFFCPYFLENQALDTYPLFEIVWGVTCDGIDIGSLKYFIDGGVVGKCLCLCLLYWVCTHEKLVILATILCFYFYFVVEVMYTCQTGYFGKQAFVCYICVAVEIIYTCKTGNFGN